MGNPGLAYIVSRIKGVYGYSWISIYCVSRIRGVCE